MSPAVFALRARFVLTLDGPPLEGGYVVIANDRIADVSAQRPAGMIVEDLGDVALLPGLINAHTHLEFSSLQEPLGQPGMALSGWIAEVIRWRSRQTGPIAAIRQGIAESVRHGVTSLCDIATLDPSVYLKSFAPDSNWVPQIVACREVIAFSRARADSAYNSLITQLANSSSEISRERIEWGLSPHAPYTVSKNLVERLAIWASKENRIVAMHLAESAEEMELMDSHQGPFVDLLRDRSMWDDGAVPRSTRPIDYLQLLASAPKSLVIHGNYLNDQELEYLGQNREKMALVICPRTCLYFGHSLDNIVQRALAMGVRLVLGTDSRASTPDLSILAELRTVHKSHPQLSPRTLWKMATEEAAAALRRGTEVGSLTPGKRADLIAIPCPGATNDPLTNILKGEAECVRSWIGGQPSGN